MAIHDNISTADEKSTRSKLLLTHALKLINAPLVVEERLELLARIIAEFMDVDDVVIFLTDPATNTLVLRASVGLDSYAVGNVRVPIGKGVTGTVAETRTYIATRNILKDPRNFYSVFSEDEKYPSLLSFPIVSVEELIGVVNIRSKVERDFTDKEAEELNNFTASIAGAIKNAQTHERLDYKSRLLELSIKIASSVTSSLDLDVILEEVAWEIAKGFSIRGVIIHLMDEAGKVIKTSSYGLKSSFVKNYNLDIARNCVLSGEPKISQIEMKEPFGDSSGLDCCNICLPITSGKKSLGVISLFDIEEDTDDNHGLFLTIGVDALLHISGLAAIAFENALIHSQLKKLADDEKKQLDDINIMYSRSSAIFDSITDGIIAVDENGVILDFNEVARTSLNLSESDRNTKNLDVITSYKPPLTKLVSDGKELSNRVVTFITPSNKFAALLTMRVIKGASGEHRGCVISFRPMEETVKMLSRFSSQRAKYTFDDIIGNSTTLIETVRLAKIAAHSTSNILIRGESGTGKELFCQSVHNESDVSEGPFIPVNCAAIPKDLIESELFGYAEGAFTGARKGGYIGKFEQATGGTLFLDEIGDMPLDLQVKLLRVLQDKVIQRVGSEHIIPINTRVIAATNRDLKTAIQDGTFREELYWRLNVITIDIPPLRDRKIDIPEFVRFFIKRFSQSLERQATDIDHVALKHLMDYSWKGNIRELENAVEHAVLISQSSVITWDDFPQDLKERYHEERHTSSSSDSVEQAQKERIDSSVKLYKEALIQAGGDVNLAANNLGISRATLYRRFNKYGITHEIYRVRRNIKNDTT